MLFKNNFKDFTRLDRELYKECINLPNGESPKIYDNLFLGDDEEPDDNVVVILSGHKNGRTLITLAAGNKSYSVSVPGCNRCHCVIADAIVDEFEDYHDLDSAVSGIVSDFGLKEGILF